MIKNIIIGILAIGIVVFGIKYTIANSKLEKQKLQEIEFIESQQEKIKEEKKIIINKGIEYNDSILKKIKTLENYEKDTITITPGEHVDFWRNYFFSTN